MKKILFSICVLLLISCNQKKEDQLRQQSNVPQALQDEKSAGITSMKKRGPNDMVDELYEEAIRNSQGLAFLEDKISDLNEMKNDSLKVFEKYKFRNQDYYTSSNRHLHSIQDSILKKEMDAVFEKDKSNYNNIIARLNELRNELDKQSLYTDDHRVVLKLFVTLGMMQQYRETNTPSSMLLGSVLNDYKTLNNKVDSAINKNK